jgi:hypothetical protein
VGKLNFFFCLFDNTAETTEKPAAVKGCAKAQEKIALIYFRFKSQAIFSYLTAKGFLLPTTRKDKSIFYYFLQKRII